MDSQRNKISWIIPFPLAVTCTVFCISTNGQAQASVCQNLISGPIVGDVTECQPIRNLSDLKSNLDAGAGEDLSSDEALSPYLKSHTGSLVTLNVISSEAQGTEFKIKGGALRNQKIKMFVPETSGLSCPKLSNKRLKDSVQEVCCSSLTNSPCLLETPYLLAKPTVAGSANTAAGDKVRTKTRATEPYQKGLKL